MPLNTDGRWSTSATTFPVPTPTLKDGAGHTLDDTRGLFVLHAVLLHTGKVLLFSGHAEFAYYAPLCYVFDPKNPTAMLTPIKFPAGMDLFCCHYVQIPNGRILVVGGADPDFFHHSSVGAKNICTFNPNEKALPEDRGWRLSRKNGRRNHLIQGRWYPTPVLLPDGRVLVVSGRREHIPGLPPADEPHPIAEKVEILSQGPRSTRDWSSTELASAELDPPLPTYPGLHLAPNGRVYFTHTTWGQEVDDPITMSIEVAAGAKWTEHPDHTPPPATRPLKRREEGMSVLLPLIPPAYEGKILVIGGSRALKADLTPVLQGAEPRGPDAFFSTVLPSDSLNAEILDTSKPSPSWSPAVPPGSPMKFGRTNGHCVLLPDETVLIVGGHNFYKWRRSPMTRPSLEAEIFTPGSGFREVAKMNESRMYHSIALLLPDGRVLVAGGADPNFNEPTLTYPPGWAGPKYGDPTDPNPLFRSNIPLNRKTFEFYEPPYYFKPDRAAQPIITDVRRGGASTERVQYGQVFTVVTPQAASIKKVSFMRPGAPTHQTDTEQRYVRLNFTTGAGQLTVTAVSDPKVAPPGYYMLWIVDDQGRPCQEARFIHLVN